MKIEDLRFPTKWGDGICRRVVMVLFTIHCSLFTCFAQDDKNVMFNPVEHAVISQTIAPDARAAGMGDVGAATDPDVNSQYWNTSFAYYCTGLCRK